MLSRFTEVAIMQSTYVAIFIFFACVCSSLRRVVIRMVVLNDFNSLFLFRSVFRQSDLLLGNYNIMSPFLAITTCLALVSRVSLSFLLLFDLCLRADWVQMVGHEGVRELITSNRHGQKLRYSVWKKGFLKDLAHAWTLLGLLNKHVSNDAFQVLWVSRRDGRVIASQDLEDQAFHRVSIKGMSQSDHLVQDATQWPNIWLLVVRLLLADLWREVVWCADSCLGTVVSVLEDTCNAEVSDLDLATLSHENVLRLEITVQNLPVVDVFDRKGHLDEPV